MLVFVIICNLLLTLLNLYVLKCLWDWRQKLKATHLILENIVIQSHGMLATAPERVLTSQRTTIALKKNYQQRVIYLQQVKQLLLLLSFILNLWQKKPRKTIF